MEDPNIMIVINSLNYSFDDDEEDTRVQPFASYPIFTPKIEPNFTPTTEPNFIHSYIRKSHMEEIERPSKHVKTEKIGPKCSSSSSSHIISFENSNSPQPIYDLDNDLVHQEVDEKQNYSRGTKRVAALSRSSVHAQDHVIAEKKRREKLNERFVALSAILPGLKKMDKATVLGDAVKHLKNLQERVKTLEEQAAKKTIESVVLVRRTQVSAIDDDNCSSSDENFKKQFDQTLPEIEAKVSDKDVLIRIHCENQKGFFVKILSEMEKLHLTIINSSVLKFGNATIDITVVAKMDVDHCMTGKELVGNLRVAFLKFM